MQAALIGVGQAGGRLAQALAEHDARAGFDAIRGVLAVNTATADLRALDVPTLQIGADRTKGQGVGGDNELGAEIARSDAVEVMDALDGVVDSGVEAVFVVAGLGGGTGSGGAPVIAREVGRVYDVPAYGVGVLPGRDEGSVYQANAARSLKTLGREADATLLVDNDAWHDGAESVSEAFAAINERIARRLGLLLAAGEAVEGVGESVVDSSEIINTLGVGGMAAVGYASAEAAPDAADNVNVATSTTRRALLTGMSLPETTRAEAALVVVAGDPDRIPRRGVERARNWVEEQTGSMAVRGGDFPLSSDRLAVLVLLAGVQSSPRLESFVARAREAAEQVDRVDPVTAFEDDRLQDLF